MAKSWSFYNYTENLTFSFFIDWFNPFSNKIGGKAVSCGVIIMFCLNLSYHLWHKPENTFFAGITPPPHEPSVVTISALLNPLVKQLKLFYSGIITQTHRHPTGTVIQLVVLSAIGDLPAIWKALGYAGIAAYHFCSFCKLDRSKYHKWPLTDLWVDDLIIKRLKKAKFRQ